MGLLNVVESAANYLNFLFTGDDSALEKNSGKGLNKEQVPEHEPYGSFGWTLERVQWACEAIERGDMGPGHELMLAMTRHPKVIHGLGLRNDQLAKVEFSHEKPPGLDQAFFDEWVNWWPQCWPRGSQGQANGHKIPLGLSPLNTTWQLKPASPLAWRPLVHLKEPLGVEWYESQRIYRFNARVGSLMEDGKPAPAAAAGSGLLDMWPLDGRRWLMLRKEPLRPHLYGAFRSLAVAWYMSCESTRWHSAHNRKHGMEWLGVKIPEAQRESKDAKELLDACITLENAGVVALPQSMNKDQPSWGLEVFSAKTEASKSMTSLRECADDYITLVLLGVLENTTGSSASDAKAQTQDRVALRLTKGDCAAIIEVHDQLARTACEENGRDPDDAPRLKCSVDDPEDRALRAQENKDNGLSFGAVATGLVQLEQANVLRIARNEKAIEYDAEAIFEQAGIMLTADQDGQQTRPQ